MTDWNRELELYSIEDILEYNDITNEQALRMIEEYSGTLEVPLAAVDDQN